MVSMRLCRIFQASLMAATLLAPVTFAEILAENAYVRATPPGHTISAAYMQLRNNSDNTVTLQSAHSDSADSVELHKSQQIEGVMRMRPAGPIEIPPQALYRLEPGTEHLMLTGLRHPLNPGERINVRLTFSDGQQLSLDLPVHSPLEMGMAMDRPETAADVPVHQQHHAH
jgi:periplasmic copper chaperone A